MLCFDTTGTNSRLVSTRSEMPRAPKLRPNVSLCWTFHSKDHDLLHISHGYQLLLVSLATGFV